MILAVFVVLQTHMMAWNWAGFSWHFTKDMVLDVLIGWALVGAWLAYYFGRAPKATT